LGLLVVTAEVLVVAVIVTEVKIKVKVKQPLYRPGQALTVSGG
jgi:hypothetical protein